MEFRPSTREETREEAREGGDGGHESSAVETKTKDKELERAFFGGTEHVLMSCITFRVTAIFDLIRLEW